VAGAVDIICVVASPADHGIGAGATVDHVVSGIADDLVVQTVAAAGNGAGRERQLLDIGAKRVVDCGNDRIDAGVGILGHRVAGIVDMVGVVAGPAGHRVGAESAVDDVIAGIACDGVVELVAGAIDGGGAGQDEILEIGAQRVADRSVDRVDAFARILGDDIAGVVDVECVVAGAADHGVGAGAAVDDVVAGIAGDCVVEPVAG